MRLDKFLQVSRICKRRSIANSVCTSNKVIVNGKACKPSYEVKIGDLIELTFKEPKMKIKVSEIKTVIRKEEATSLYEIL